MSENRMKCADCDELFPDYFEGALTGQLSESFDEHVSHCARCQGLIRDIDGIKNEATALPELSPSRDLWSGIESRIQPEVLSIESRSSGRISRRWLVAAAAVLIVATSGVTYVATTRSLGGHTTRGPTATVVAVAPQVAIATPPVSAAAEASSAALPEHGNAALNASRGATPAAAWRTGSRASLASSSRRAPASASELAFAGEIIQLQSVLVERRSQLDPETVKVVEDNLKVIEIALNRARSALAKDPASGFLTRQLEGTLQKKVELLRTLALLPAST